MLNKKLLTDIVTTFVITAIVSVVVTYVWTLIDDGADAISLSSSLQFAAVLGITLPIVKAKT
ncbi:hypothetical protein CL632_00735 [bacterium]|jgi:hypothetical protein|nr:hypothetical protein [bacterium]MDP6571485.1 hypothetical protein [Patescibacteria group bacterium]MDP6756552.1 hypothetical protein [Patescibacteria group bacterium]|tara:strand:+ start:41822 stop:42007 length:186 start_codon:yes stop_codon:yes gene_type:complete